MEPERRLNLGEPWFSPSLLIVFLVALQLTFIHNLSQWLIIESYTSKQRLFFWTLTVFFKLNFIQQNFSNKHFTIQALFIRLNKHRDFKHSEIMNHPPHYKTGLKIYLHICLQFSGQQDSCFQIYFQHNDSDKQTAAFKQQLRFSQRHTSIGTRTLQKYQFL